MLQSSIGAVFAFSAADQNFGYLILTSMGILIAWLFSIRPNKPAPRVVINTILLGVVVIAGIEMLRIGVGVNAFAVFVALLLVVKLLDLREPRDEGQVLVLTVAILISGVLTSNSLMTGVLMVLVSVLILRAVILFQLHTVLHKSAPADETIAKQARIDIRSMVLATGFLCALVGSVIFVVLPRDIGMRAFGQWGGAVAPPTTGFTDTVQLGRPGRITESPTPVMDLSIYDREGNNIGGRLTQAIYLRGAVLNSYEKGIWTTKGTGSTHTLPIPPNTILRANSVEDTLRWSKEMKISLRSVPSGLSHLFTPWKTVEFHTGSQRLRLGFDFNNGLFMKDGYINSLEYSVRSVDTDFDQIDFSQFEHRNPVNTEEYIDPSVRQLAVDILERGDIEPDPALRPVEDDGAAVRLIERHLRLNFAYTLESQPIPPGKDATEWFLFERGMGHCEYYASALTLMARSVGVPTRVITGYVVSDYNDVSGQYIVRQSNAHAWVESEIAPGHWRTYDGTPVDDFQAIHVPEPNIWRSIAKVYESIETLWVKGVVGYDARTRQNIMGESNPDLGISKISDSLMDRLAAGRGKLVGRAAVIGAIVFCASMLLGLFGLRYKQIVSGVWEQVLAWIDSLRLKLRKGHTPIGDPRYSKLEQLLHRKLERLDIPKPEWKPLRRHVDEHHDRLLSIAQPERDAIIEVSRLLYLHRFAGDHAPVEPGHALTLETSLRLKPKPIA
mgnify:FL=1|tara:strand:+ start:78039 stop:80216 length:2178 start_codon:yes stop_codon:yes gene_type:complete